MKAAVIHEHGGPGSIKYESNFPDPTPAPDEVILKVGAATLNFVRFGKPTEFGHTYLNVVQAAQIQNLILQGYNAIVINAASITFVPT